VLELPRDWSPLVYCWRGGQRSGSLGLVLSQIGFRVHVLEGGYQAFRRAVVAALETLPTRTRSSSSAAPPARARACCCARSPARGEQVLDLEALANHRGSVLGLVPARRSRRRRRSTPRSGTRCATRFGAARVRREREREGRRPARAGRC
jgi:tRNA 2-selenouridine synthase